MGIHSLRRRYRIRKTGTISWGHKLGGPPGESLVRSPVEPVCKSKWSEAAQESALAVVAVRHRRVPLPGDLIDFVIGADLIPPEDRRRLVTGPELRQKVATVVGRHLRANPPENTSVDDVGAALAAVIMGTAELVISPQELRRPGQGWRGDAQTETKLQAANDAIRAAWQHLKMGTRGAQLRRAVRKAYNWLKRVRSAAVVRFFGRHVVELEKQLCMGDQHRPKHQIDAAGGDEEGRITARL